MRKSYPKRNLIFASLALASALALPSAASADATFEVLRSYYSVDAHLPQNVVVSDDSQTEGVRRIEFTYTSFDNQIVPAQLDIPLGVENPAVIIALHGITQSRHQWWRADDGSYSFPSKHRAALIKAGFAVLAIDERAHGERMVPTDFQDQSVIVQNGYFDAGRKIVAESVLDVRRAIDALATIEGVDHDRIGVLGFSLGALIGHISTSVDPRIDAAFIMAMPFLPVTKGQTASFTAPSNYIEGLKSKPLGYLAATKDVFYTRTDVEAFASAFPEAPEVDWVESEHDMPAETSEYSLAFFLRAL